jgi:hypothetical protein
VKLQITICIWMTSSAKNSSLALFSPVL